MYKTKLLINISHCVSNKKTFFFRMMNKRFEEEQRQKDTPKVEEE